MKKLLLGLATAFLVASVMVATQALDGRENTHECTIQTVEEQHRHELCQDIVKLVGGCRTAAHLIRMQQPHAELTSHPKNSLLSSNLVPDIVTPRERSNLLRNIEEPICQDYLRNAVCPSYFGE